MKVKEILKEDDFDDAAAPESRHTSDNLGYAASELALQEFMKIEKDPMGYFKSHGEDAAKYANKIAGVLSQIDDETFNLMGNSPMVQHAIESNYDPESDSSYIPLDTMLEILTKVEQRLPAPEKRGSAPNEQRMGYDAGRPGQDDFEAYDR